MPTIKKIRQAVRQEHDGICKIAKQSKYTSAFSNMVFSGEDCYAAGRIRILVSGGQILGFTCWRQRIRDRWLVLYFVGVDAAERNKGLGTLLVTDLLELSEIGIELKVMKDNPAVRLYTRLGFVQVGEEFNGQAWLMRKQKTPAG